MFICMCYSQHEFSVCYTRSSKHILYIQQDDDDDDDDK